MNKLEWRQVRPRTNPDTRTQRNGVRELRPACWHSHASKPEKKKPASKAEEEQAKGLAFSLSAPLAFRSLPLLALSGELVPSQTASSNLGAHNGEPIRISQLAPVVAKRLFVQIAKQVKRFHADVRAVQLTFHQTPEVLHRIRVNIAASRTLRRGPRRRVDIRRKAHRRTSANR